ncbi:MAG: putative phage tail protein [Alphaproteobacteria bacterium]|jgi:uncharacterized protein YmfQ (DUF2313 family)|nr:MAG TPA: Protein of unknown function (DUF2612) [Caudoviricetes sp.]
MNYLNQLYALLPKGRIWEQKPDSVMCRLLSVAADALYDVHLFFEQILRESDISTATELSLDEWETDYGLPDICSYGVNTLPIERRKAVQSRMNMGAGQEKTAYEQVIKDLGYVGTVTALQPFVCGKSYLGKDALNNEMHCRFCLIVSFYPRITTFMNENGEMEEKTVYGDDLLCTLDRMKQSHTRIYYKILED